MRKRKQMALRRSSILVAAFFFLGAFSGSAFAVSNVEDQFREANRLYRDGKYAEAARIYEEIAESKPMAEVYYNLGNAYFKDQKLGSAILNYERARRYGPRDRDILANLSYAERLIEYKVEDKRNWYFRKKSEWLKYVSFEECGLLALGAYFLFGSGFLIALLRKKRPLFGTSGALAFAFVVFCLVPLLLKYGEFGRGRRAVVTQAQAEVRYGPSPSDRIAFRLVEGLEISVHDEKQDWYRIQLNDGRSGWVPQSQVTPI